jgi:hypothetical protein
MDAYTSVADRDLRHRCSAPRPSAHSRRELVTAGKLRLVTPQVLGDLLGRQSGAGWSRRCCGFLVSIGVALLGSWHVRVSWASRGANPPDILNIPFGYPTPMLRRGSAAVPRLRPVLHGHAGPSRGRTFASSAPWSMRNGKARIAQQVPIDLSQAHTPHRLARFRSSRLSWARSLACSSSPGTSLPVPKYISSGVCPRNAEWGRRSLCCST